jgi:hypothetical protein
MGVKEPRDVSHKGLQIQHTTPEYVLAGVFFLVGKGGKGFGFDLIIDADGHQ